MADNFYIDKDGGERGIIDTTVDTSEAKTRSAEDIAASKATRAQRKADREEYARRSAEMVSKMKAEGATRKEMYKERSSRDTRADLKAGLETYGSQPGHHVTTSKNFTKKAK